MVEPAAPKRLRPTRYETILSYPIASGAFPRFPQPLRAGAHTEYQKERRPLASLNIRSNHALPELPIASRAIGSSGTRQTPSTIDVKVGSATCVLYPFVLYP